MSSWLGHGIAATTIYLTDRKAKPKLTDLVWLYWLILVAIAPDIYYLIVALRVGDDHARITHSIVGVLLLPALTIAFGIVVGWRGNVLRTRSFQVIAAGLSHIVLDLLVGVNPMPLFFPFSLTTYKLPFGILPSAPLARLDNPLLYRNLLIELGVLLPLALIGFLATRHFLTVSHRRLAIILLVICSILFMGWAFTLER